MLFTFFPTVQALEFTPSLIPLEEIKAGGPPKDGIPALLRPKFLSSKEASYLEDEDRVVGITVGTESKAYPIQILNWHEIVNDQINKKGVVISYCPLCGTAMIFDATIEGKKHTFGVSGLLYNSDVLMYDHQTESLWSQLKMQAVTGKRVGTPLRLLASEVSTWKEWKTRHPKTLVLSQDTGYTRDYDQDPYKGYSKNKKLYFTVSHEDPSRHPKDWVFGLVEGTMAKAYPYKELANSTQPLWDQFAGRTIKIIYNEKSQTVRAESRTGQLLPGVSAYWFAWKAFYPDSEVFQEIPKEVPQR
ncbi:hypothetical protein BVX98_01800 [bacterium F11]|nr:hypothetical protein BVX98_01800 [bacterium F11]